MFLNNYNQIKNKEIYFVLFLILFSIIVRLPVVFMFGDTNIENEWGNLYENLIIHGKLIYENFGETLLPNLWMPPLYAYYIYFFSIFSNSETVVTQLVLYSQTVMAGVSVAFFYKLSKNFFSKNISFVSSLLFSIVPLHLYACSQISSISLQVFLIILFLFFFFQIVKNYSFLSIVGFSASSGMLILLRGESIAIVSLSIIYLFLFFKTSIKKILLILLVILITVSPYLIRNIIIFEKAIIIKSFGYNFWRGNHPLALEKSLVEGSEIHYGNLREKVKQIPKDNFYRFEFDKLYFDEGNKNIKKEPLGYLILMIKKGMSFLLINYQSMDPKYFHPANYLPLLFFGITSLIGIILYKKQSPKFNYLLLVLLAYVGIFSLVAILPRYKLIILPLQIIFTSVFIEKIKNYYVNFKKNK
jgi:hypothetical protein